MLRRKTKATLKLSCWGLMGQEQAWEKSMDRSQVDLRLTACLRARPAPIIDWN